MCSMLLKCGDFVRVRVCSEKNIFFVRTNRKLKFAYKNRKNPDKIRVFLWLYLFCSPLMAEMEGFEPPHALRRLADFESAPFSHLGTSPADSGIIPVNPPKIKTYPAVFSFFQ